jgi:tetratricopeptide (TPR) repeat protein
MALGVHFGLDAPDETADPAPMLKRFHLRTVSAAAFSALALAGCANMSATTTAGLRPSQTVSTPDDNASQYGLFLAGRTAMDLGNGQEAADYLARASAVEPDQTFLKESAFTAALVAGDVHRAAVLAPQAADSSQSMQRLGRLTQAVDHIAAGEGRQAEALLTGDPLGPPYRSASALLLPWAAAEAGDWKTALTLQDPHGDRLVAQVSLLNQALLYEKNRRYADADKTFKTLMTDGDGAALYTSAYGEFLERRGRKAEADAVYVKALKTDPTSHGVLAARARLAAGKAPPPAPTLTQGAAQALLAPAALFLADKQQELGLAYLRLVLRLDPQRDEAWLLVGDSMSTAGDVDAARAAYNHPQPGSPDYLGARARLIETYQQPSDAPVVLKLAQDTVQAAPGDPDALTLLADALRTSERYQDSADVLDKLIAARGAAASWDLYYMRGVALEQAGHWPEAERDLKKALALKPDEPDILNYLGYSWIDRGEQVQAGKAMIEKALAAKPDSGAIVDSLGWAYYKLGDYDQSVQQLERATELEPADAEINDHLGDAYWRDGRRIEAAFQWRRVLTLQPDAKLKARVEAKLKDGGPADSGPKHSSLAAG